MIVDFAEQAVACCAQPADELICADEALGADVPDTALEAVGGFRRRCGAAAQKDE